MKQWRWLVLAGFTLVVGCNTTNERGAPAGSRGTGSAVDSLLARGDSLFAAEQYEPARDVWRAALQDARAARDSAAQARALLSLASVGWQLGSLDESRRAGEEALAIITRRKMSGEAGCPGTPRRSSPPDWKRGR